jgi:hypothetical protein
MSDSMIAPGRVTLPGVPDYLTDLVLRVLQREDAGSALEYILSESEEGPECGCGGRHWICDYEYDADDPETAPPCTRPDSARPGCGFPPPHGGHGWEGESCGSARPGAPRYRCCRHCTHVVPARPDEHERPCGYPECAHLAEPIAACPGCGTSPAYRRKLADPWDTHQVCPGCGHCYTHEAT